MYFPTEVIAPDVAVIRGTGRLNLLTAPQLDRTVRSVLGQGRSKIVLDLSEVEFLDPTGLGAVIAARNAARAQGGDLRLVGPGPQPSLVLTTTHMDRVLAPHPDVHTAYAD